MGIRSIRAVMLVLVALAPAACRQNAVPALLDVTELASERVESGELIEIVGAGFAAGRTADVVFRGNLYRPGEPERSHVVVAARGRAASESKLQVAMDAELIGAFTRHESHFDHTTFEGDIEISFAAQDAAAPAVFGTLRAVTLDILPPRAIGSGDSAALQNTVQILAAAGLRAEVLDGQGLVVHEVVPASSADKLGLASGDRLLACSGVRVRALEDCEPAPGASDMRVVIRREGVPRDETRTLSVRAPALVSRGSLLLYWISAAAACLGCAPIGAHTQIAPCAAEPRCDCASCWCTGDDAGGAKLRGAFGSAVYAVLADP
jgi:hypothetical protein